MSEEETSTAFESSYGVYFLGQFRRFKNIYILPRYRDDYKMVGWKDQACPKKARVTQQITNCCSSRIKGPVGKDLPVFKKQSELGLC